MGDHQICDGMISSLLQDDRMQRQIVQELQKKIAELEKQLVEANKGKE